MPACHFRLTAVPAFKTITHLPPFMGIMFGLGILWLVGDLVHRHKEDENKQHLTLVHALRNAYLFASEPDAPLSMSRPTPLNSVIDSIVRGYMTWLLPRLVELPPSNWKEAINKAKNIAFVTVEQISSITDSLGLLGVLLFDEHKTA